MTSAKTEKTTEEAEEVNSARMEKTTEEEEEVKGRTRPQKRRRR